MKAISKSLKNIFQNVVCVWINLVRDQTAYVTFEINLVCNLCMNILRSETSDAILHNSYYTFRK